MADVTRRGALLGVAGLSLHGIVRSPQVGQRAIMPDGHIYTVAIITREYVEWHRVEGPWTHRWRTVDG